VRVFDQGRSMIDLDPPRKILFRADFRVMSHGACSAAMILLSFVRSS
jgi:hypothetical protein